MEEADIVLLEAATALNSQVLNILIDFQQRNEDTVTFPELKRYSRRMRVWKALINLLSASASDPNRRDILACLRILSRDTTDLGDISPRIIDVLLLEAGIVGQEEAVKHINDSENLEVLLESLKCLCNIIFNCKKAQLLCSSNNTVLGIVDRLRTYRERSIPDALKYFDMKILFLITALCPNSSQQLKDELHGMTYLMELIDYTLKEASDGVECLGAVGGLQSPLCLSNEKVQVICEVLKVLFTICCQDKGLPLDEESEAHGQRLVCILRDLLLANTTTSDKQVELQNHTINMLTAVPTPCLSALMAPLSDRDNSENLVEYEGRNMEAIVVLLHVLEAKLDGQGEENFSPILTVLTECAMNHRLLRKFLRLQILPHLRDTHRRPEDGHTLRNRLCRFLTSPNSQIKQIVAELLFVLCKENGRMIKYVGYGNAAGLLVIRGLLAGRPDGDTELKYSSESEDSDTEEYKKYRHEMNPVTGCWEPPRVNPLEGMSEEQKECEAVRLANLMAKLCNEGIVQPCRIGEDGRPEPVDHILQLQEDLPRQQIRPPPSPDENCD